LILATELADQEFRNRAIELGGLLLTRAERRENCLSWPNNNVEASRNLTGLSHGTAGVAVALSELGRATGGGAFLAAAYEAVGYEDAAYSAADSNWPDYRTFGDDARKPTSPDLWCHGSAGIILSRLRLATLLRSTEIAAAVPAATERLRGSAERDLSNHGANFNLCHGIAGKAEVLREASQWGNAKANWQPRAAATAVTCWRSGAATHVPTRSWPCSPHIDAPFTVSRPSRDRLRLPATARPFRPLGLGYRARQLGGYEAGLAPSA